MELSRSARDIGKRLAKALTFPSIFVAVFAVHASSIAQPAAGEERTIELGRPITSTLDPSDAASMEEPQEHFRLTLAEGARVRIDMEAIDPTPRFDTYLIVLGPNGQELAQDDDGGEGLNSRLLFTAQAAGTYTIRARGFGGRAGSFRLTVAAAGTPATPRPVAVGINEGSFGPTSALGEVAGDVVRYEEFEFTGVSGERVHFLVTGPIAPQVALEMLDASGSPLDDGASFFRGPSPRILFTLRQSGTYRVRVGVPATVEGGYRLTFSRAVGAPEEETVRRIVIGQAVEGALSLTSPFAEADGQVLYFHQLYALEVRAGQAIRIIVQSDQFTPVVEAGSFSPIGFATAAESERTRTGSQLDLRPRSRGILQLRVRSPSASIGAFTLRVEPGPPAPAL
jgi:hypothetical protein